MEELLIEKGVRPTRIRKAVAGWLFDGHDKHVTVEDVIEMARKKGFKASVASIYNTLNQFAEAGLLCKVNAGQGKAFFDTNLSEHHHFYFEDEGRIEDIKADDIQIGKLPKIPKGRKLKSVSVMIKV